MGYTNIKLTAMSLSIFISRESSYHSTFLHFTAQEVPNTISNMYSTRKYFWRLLPPQNPLRMHEMLHIDAVFKKKKKKGSSKREGWRVFLKMFVEVVC